ncbi:RNA polymerase sigma factor [Dyadobacter sp. NIV53]|uniref:RNA polymerase sigma factor n=1 Tax=Dyadobacter sp. NIV53 TaxID=2861765 RepID=UPI001C87EF8D|nr:RNA polymerase sigma factor [Dyadobacter sp. NIV53]
MEQVSHADNTHWNAIKDGNKVSLGELYQLYYRQLYRYGNRLQSDSDTIEDTIQDLFVNIWNTRHKLPELRNVKSYLFTIFRREILRKSKSDQFAVDIDDISDSLNLFEETHYEQDDYEKWLINKLGNTLKSLPKRQLDVVMLRYYENFSTSEISSIMGITEKSVRNTLHKAICHLRINIQALDYLLFILFCINLL